MYIYTQKYIIVVFYINTLRRNILPITFLTINKNHRDALVHHYSSCNKKSQLVSSAECGENSKICPNAPYLNVFFSPYFTYANLKLLKIII